MKTARRLTLAAVAALNILGIGSAQADQDGTSPSGPRMGLKAHEFLMTKITVSDVMKSYDFYTRIVGLKQVTAPAIGLGAAPPTAAENDKDMLEVALNYEGSLRDPLFILLKRRGATPNRTQAGLVWVAFRVPNVRAVVERAEAAGFRQFRPPLAGGQVAFIHDPDGYAVEIMQIPPFELAPS